MQAGDQWHVSDRVSGVPAAPAPGCRGAPRYSCTMGEWLGQETKLLLCALRCAVTRSEARRASLATQWVKSLPAVRKSRVQSLDWEDPLEKEMAAHSSIPTWRIPWTVEPGGLQSMGHKSRTRLSN